MPESYEISAALVPRLSRLENLVRFHVEKAQSHGAMAHDAFQMAPSAAAAILLVRVEGNHGMAALPHAFDLRIQAEADSVAQRPYPDQPVEVPPTRRQSRGDNIGVVV